MRSLILTFDYELFGNGSGDVFRHMIEPMGKILEICDEYGVKVTIFFEVLEYIRIKEEWDKGNTMGYMTDPVKAIEDQLHAAVLNGHDVQVHVHPQWIRARYEGERWVLDPDNWRLGDFNASPDYTVDNLLKDAVHVTENLIRQVVPGYKCLALRAGYYNIMPSVHIFRSMRSLGMKIDSSIYPGGKEDSKFQKFDFSGITNDTSYWWADASDIRKPSDNSKEILEVPIFSLPVSPVQRVFTLSKVRSLLLHGRKSMSAGSQEKMGNRSLPEKIIYLLRKEATPWDVCSFHKSLHRKYFNYLEKKVPSSRKVFVLIGHPKNLNNAKIFRDFLRTALDRRRKYTIGPLVSLYEEIG